MSELYSWQTIGTLAGAAMITYLIVAYTKSLRFLNNISTDLYAVVVGTLVLLAAMGAQGELTGWPAYVLCLFNGFLVAAAAGKVNDKAVTEYERYYPEPIEEESEIGNSDGM